MPPFTRSMADAQGITRDQLTSGRYRRVMHGVYLPSTEPLTLQAWIEAARLVLPPDAVPIGLTALQVAGLGLGQPLPLRFATATSLRSTRSEIVLRRVRSDQLRSDPLDALIDHCRTAGLLDAVTAADRAVQLGIVRPLDLLRLAAHSSSSVRKAGRLASCGAESVRETRLRLCLELAGLPRPRLQMELRDDEGFVGRFDMGYDEFLLLIEYEGEQHLNDKVQWTRDIVRESRPAEWCTDSGERVAP